MGAVYNTSIPAEIEDFIRGDFARTPNCCRTRGVTVSSQDNMSRAFQYWVKDAYTDAKFLSKYDENLHSGASEMISALGIDVSDWKDGYNPSYEY